MIGFVGAQGSLSFVSAILSMAIAIYIIYKNPRRTVNIVGGLLGIMLAWWAFGDCMVAASSSYASKIFWIRAQGYGELPFVPLYFTLALYFPDRRRIVSDKKRAALTLTLVFLPFLAALPLLSFTDLIYPQYMIVAGPYGIIAEPSFFFCVLTFMGYALALASSLLFLQAYRHDRSGIARTGLLPAALAPAVLLVGNIIQTSLTFFYHNSIVTTPHFSFIFIAVLGYGVLRYGFFIDPGMFVRRAVYHALALGAMVGGLIGIVFFVDRVLHPVKSAGFLIIVSLVMVVGLLYFPLLDKYIARRVARAMKAKHYHGQEAMRGFARSMADMRDLGELADSVSALAKKYMKLDACAILVSETPGFYRILNHDPAIVSLLHLEPSESGDGAMIMEGKSGYTVFSAGGALRSSWLAGFEYERKGMKFRVLRPSQEPANPDFSNLLCMRFDLGSRGSGLLWMGKRTGKAQWAAEDMDLLGELEPRLSLSIMNAQLLDEVVIQRERLRVLARRASQARESERVRISRELHDSAAQFILDVIFRLESFDELNGANGSADQEAILELREKAKEGLRELRRVISDLRPPVLEVLGLQRSLESWTSRFGKENGVRVDFSMQEGLEWDELEEITIFRLVQEALANVARHAEAEQVKVSLTKRGRKVCLAVQDDGRGFNLAEVRRRQQAGEALGLAAMEERVELLKGELIIVTQPGHGTRVEMTLPFEQAGEEESDGVPHSPAHH